MGIKVLPHWRYERAPRLVRTCLDFFWYIQGRLNLNRQLFPFKTCTTLLNVLVRNFWEIAGQPNPGYLRPHWRESMSRNRLSDLLLPQVWDALRVKQSWKGCPRLFAAPRTLFWRKSPEGSSKEDHQVGLMVASQPLLQAAGQAGHCNRTVVPVEAGA